MRIVKKYKRVWTDIKATCETLNTKVDTIATDVSLIKTETGETKTTLDRFAANPTTQLAEIRAEQSRHAEMVEIILAAEWTAAFGGLEASVEAAQTLRVAGVDAVGVELAGQLEMTSYSLNNSINETKKKLTTISEKLDKMEKEAAERQKETDKKIDKFWESAVRS